MISKYCSKLRGWKLPKPSLICLDLLKAGHAAISGSFSKKKKTLSEVKQSSLENMGIKIKSFFSLLDRLGEL